MQDCVETDFLGQPGYTQGFTAFAEFFSHFLQMMEPKIVVYFWALVAQFSVSIGRPTSF